MKNITRYVSDFVYEGQNENGDLVNIDMRGPDEKKGHSPTELLLSAVSACAAVDIVLTLKKKRKIVKDFVVETDGDRNEDHPRSFTRIHSKYILTSPDTKPEELMKITGLVLDKYCSVASSLNVKVDFSVEIRDTE
ncbi:OsmC family protein [Fulvivirgaceae bacterium BMA10]|uniref:OsmC family protein n=1 Tax=Splendidivirga corallicola TaxID=3051826 RepID=A0ABT8KGR5_9BACT|nr:OsmC family protein [Fulvivirgaceae bacterium BMA10]